MENYLQEMKESKNRIKCKYLSIISSGLSEGLPHVLPSCIVRVHERYRRRSKVNTTALAFAQLATVQTAVKRSLNCFMHFTPAPFYIRKVKGLVQKLCGVLLLFCF